MKTRSLPTKISSVFSFLWLLLLIAIVLLTLYGLLFTSKSQAATIAIGQTYYTWTFPFGTTPEGTAAFLGEFQQIYDSSFFPSETLISQIALMSNWSKAAVDRNYVLSIGFLVTERTPTNPGIGFATGATPAFSGSVVEHFTPVAKDWDFVLGLTTPFLYDPALGNLLLDIKVTSATGNPATSKSIQFLGPEHDGPFAKIVSYPEGVYVAPREGLATRFTVDPVPEPATAALLSLGAALCIPRRPRRRIATVFTALLSVCAFHSPASTIISGPITSKTEAPFGVNTKGAAAYTGEYQEIYSATLFPSAMWITQIGFSDSGSVVTKDLPYNLTIGLGVTARTPAAPGSTFAPGATPVFSGAVTAHITAAINDFDFLIPLTTPFFYDPSKGNLLLDACWISAAGTLNGGVGYGYGYTRDSGNVGLIQKSGNGAIGLPFHGVVTQFTVNPVPEPATAALISLGAALCIPRRVRGDR